MPQTSTTNQTYATPERMNRCGYRRGMQPKPKPRIIMTYKFVAYVPKHKSEEYVALGWTVRDSLAGTPHGEWSYIGEYISDRDEEPPTPKAAP